MARLTAAERRRIPRDRAHFLVPSKAPGPGSYPIIDKEHKQSAVGLSAMHGHPGIEAKAKASLGKAGHMAKAHEHVMAAHRQHNMSSAREHLSLAAEHLKKAGANTKAHLKAERSSQVGGYDWREDERNAK